MEYEGIWIDYMKKIYIFQKEKKWHSTHHVHAIGTIW
jgi:hypothetical protein